MAMWGMLKKIFLRHNSSDEEELQNEQSLCDASNVNSEPHAMDGMEDAVEHKPVNESAEAAPDSGLHDKNVRKIMRPVMFIWHYLKENEPYSVYVCGSWDGWLNHTRLHKSDSYFSAVINLEPGYYEFKFYVDNEWMTNENIPYIDVGYYSKNIITVKEEENHEIANEKNDL